jgi:hypothetical protein
MSHASRLITTLTAILVALPLPGAAALDDDNPRVLRLKDVVLLPLAGHWLNTTGPHRPCTDVPAGSDEPGAADMDITPKGNGFTVTGLEYSATYTLVRARSDDTGSAVLEMKGREEGEGEIAELHELWLLSKTAGQEDVLTAVQWTDRRSTDDGSDVKTFRDPLPSSATFIHCPPN